ncbi:hypothetical protein ACFC0M_22560 [Streptomyces sp. NPDC056149]|uniref:hypothetical protein n=1 Tax=Streptomyces sp. NPDC056149 TaxID=3345728 RepID=UPI0035DCA919
MTNPVTTARLLPWTSLDGKPCYLLGGDGTGYVSRLADAIEAEQMDSAAALIEEARGILAGRAWTPGEIHLLAVELNANLANVRRVSESRGARLLALEGAFDASSTDGEDDEVSKGGEGHTDSDVAADDASAARDPDDADENTPPPAHDSPDRSRREQGRRPSPSGRGARLAAPVRPAGSAPGAPLKDAARVPPAR